jgi:phospholipid/cholesterol/gamma-HCH transport system substrate-binding protein
VIKQALGDGPLKLPRAKPFAGDPSAKPRVREPIDRTLGGLVEVTR